VVVDELEGGFKTTCSTCAGGGASFTSLREGRRRAAACLRRPQAPAIVDNHPHAPRLRSGVVLVARRTFDRCQRVPIWGGYC